MATKKPSSSKKSDSLQTTAQEQRGRPFEKGKSGNPSGRKKGSPNKATAEAKDACAAIVDDSEYRRNLLEAARKRELAPAVETMLWHYAHGKPKEQVEHSMPDGIALRWESE